MAELPIYIALVISAGFLVWGLRSTVAASSTWQRATNGTLTVAAAGLVMVSGAIFWYTHRPQPDALQQMLYPGVEYIRDVRTEPRPVVMHIVKIDLTTPGLEFLVTPPEYSEDNVLEARTTSDFLETFDLQLAVNGDFYEPFRDESPLDYYPHVDDPVSPRGLAASNGELYTRGYVSPRWYNTLYISADNVASFEAPGDGRVYNAISGWQMLVRDGAAVPIGRAPYEYAHQPQPRTVFALDESGETLMLIVVDGRQPNYSEGLTLDELTTVALEYGASDALNMDGGGSVSLVNEGVNGDAQVLNSPIHSRIPGRERPVANHLGIYLNAP